MNEQAPQQTVLENSLEVEFDYESILPEKIKLFEVPEMIGKPTAEVIEYVKSKYSDEYLIPGVGYRDYISENPNKANDSLKDESYHYFLGPLQHFSNGNESATCAFWNGAQFVRFVQLLTEDWKAGYRVVLIEK